MRYLGLSCYFHDSAAALVDGHEVVAAAEEERFTRIKHDDAFPVHAIEFCLKQGGIRASDLDAVCFYEKPLLKLERTLVTGRAWCDGGFDLLRRQLARLVHEEILLEKVLESTIGYGGRVLYGSHHLSHAASAFYPSPFEEAAVLTVDGVGEWATTATFRGRGATLERIAEIRYPHSLGLLYTTLTAWLGFRANSDEYKVMGLAAYGTPVYMEEMRRLLSLHDDGSFSLDLRYFAFPCTDERMHTGRLEELLGPPRPRETPITQHHRDVAASLQKALEEAMVALAEGLHRETNCPNLCLAGGVALNGVANWRILRETPFERVFIQPAAGDSGGALGAALQVAYRAESPRRPGHSSTLLGPEFSDEEIFRTLETRGARFRQLEPAELIERTAELIHADRIVGWFQGRMEFGPRALGCRSLLANPCNPEMQGILNSRVKFREAFRPFAPAVPVGRAAEYFEIDFPSPYMLLIPKVRPHARELVPAVVHVDSSARLQTVDPATQPRFHALLEAFGRRSGVPILINTSFNVQGEPIVCSPEDAYACFERTDIDFLVMGSYLVEKDI